MKTSINQSKTPVTQSKTTVELPNPADRIESRIESVVSGESGFIDTGSGHIFSISVKMNRAFGVYYRYTTLL